MLGLCRGDTESVLSLNMIINDHLCDSVGFISLVQRTSSFFGLVLWSLKKMWSFLREQNLITFLALIPDLTREDEMLTMTGKAVKSSFLLFTHLTTISGLSPLGNWVPLILPMSSVTRLIVIMVSNDNASVSPELDCMPALPFSECTWENVF